MSFCVFFLELIAKNNIRIINIQWYNNAILLWKNNYLSNVFYISIQFMMGEYRDYSSIHGLEYFLRFQIFPNSCLFVFPYIQQCNFLLTSFSLPKFYSIPYNFCSPYIQDMIASFSLFYAHIIFSYPSFTIKEHSSSSHSVLSSLASFRIGFKCKIILQKKIFNNFFKKN